MVYGQCDLKIRITLHLSYFAMFLYVFTTIITLPVYLHRVLTVGLKPDYELATKDESVTSRSN